VSREVDGLRDSEERGLIADDGGRLPDGQAGLAVLVVNDSESQRLAIRAMLAPLGLVIVEAGSGRAALRATISKRFALIVMDLRMPTMDGFATANLIRQWPDARQVPIIFLTAFGHDDERASLAGYATGAVDFMYMPVAGEVLRAKVSAFLDLFLLSAELQRSIDSITTANTALRDGEATTQAVIDTVADGILTVGESGLIESSNPSARQLFGYSEEEMIGEPATLLFAPTVHDELRHLASGAPGWPTTAATAATANRTRAIETMGRRRDGSTFAMEVAHGLITRGAGKRGLVFVRDISRRRAYTESLEHRALHDDLTGLANRTLFEEHMLRAIAMARRGHTSGALLVLDLNGFKQVNDTFGHEHGDRLLQQVAGRLSGAVRGTDTVARLGGDEFAILPGGATDLTAAAAIAWKLEEACAVDLQLDEGAVQMSASVGIAVFPEHGESPAVLLRRADAAMYVAKRSGNSHAVFDGQHEVQATRKLALLSDLRQCISRDELVLHYQPRIDLATRQVAGVEALVRWQHPDRGLLMPGHFLGDVERTEMITPLTRWVLDAALRQQRTWRGHGFDLPMSVNIAASSMRTNARLPEMIADVAAAWGGAPDGLTLELNEGALVETDAPGILDELHQMGARVAVDDFGSGYSSLAHLQRLPIDELMIDRSLVTNLSLGSDDAVVVRSTIDLAHSLGLSVVAKGVEGETVMDLLVTYGCDSAQGYLVGRPSSAAALDDWLSGASQSGSS
jgi:diguanylate cyclase (GGDEF)-like protein/PAS domain S-box-containing protein